MKSYGPFARMLMPEKWLYRDAQTKNLYVRTSKREAQYLINHLGLGEDWIGVGLGESLMGHRFDKIIMDIDDKYIPETKKEKIQDYKQLCKTKLKPEGELIHI